MFQRNPPTRSLLCLSLVLLVAGIFGCSRSSQGEEGQEGQPAAAGSAAPGQATAPGASSPATPATPANPANPADTKPVKPEELPAVVARINGQEIKKEELLDRAQKLRTELASAGAGEAPLNTQFYREVLNTLVAQALLQQEAREQGFKVTDAEVDQQIAALKGRFPDAEKFKQALASQGLSEERLRTEMYREGAVQKLVEAKVFSAVNVTDADAKDFYDKNQDKMKQPPRAHLRHILVGVDAKATDADKQKARAKADDLLKRAQGGEEFAKLASENSDDPGSKARGGDLSWIMPGQTVPPFEKAAFALSKPNEISPVVETQFGYHVIQLVERQEASTVPFDQAKERITNFLKQRQVQEKLQAHVEELKAKGKVETFI